MNTKTILTLFSVIFLASIISAQNLEINLDKNIYQQGERIQFIVQLFAENGEPINDQVDIEFVDATEINVKKTSVSSNIKQEFDLGENANLGYWKIIASYK